MEIRISQKDIEVEREWKVGDVFSLDDTDFRMIIKYNNSYCGLNLESGYVSSEYHSIATLMKFYTDGYDVKRMNATLTLTEE